MEREEQTVTDGKISIEQYLEKVARFCDNKYGGMVRQQFKDSRGSSELGMLATPTGQELEEIKRAVSIMTPAERDRADGLTDEEIEKIAGDARVDPANFAIFMNGYVLQCKCR